MATRFGTLNSIQQQFDRAAKTYDQNSAIQRRIAEALIVMMQEKSLRPNRIVELGCGTGNLTQRMIEAFPESQILATDSSKSMLSECASRLGSAQVQFQQLGAQDFSGNDVKCDLVASSMTLQWVDDWPHVVTELCQQATVCFSIPIQGSFSSWVDAHHELGLRCGLRPLPSLSDLR